MKQFLCVFLIVTTATIACGCSYGGIVTLSEQIAIYQNLGFIRVPLAESLTIGEQTFKLNDMAAINNYLLEQNCDARLTEATVLYLPSEDANKLEALLFIYYFATSKEAKVFFKCFATTWKENLHIYNNSVIQKGASKLIASSSANTEYFIKFVGGLKNK